MKKLICTLVAMLCAGFISSAAEKEKPVKEKPAAPVAGGEKHVLFKLYDHAKNFTYEVRSMTEFRKLKAELDQEARLFPRAVALAEREWKANEENKRSFPRSAASLRDIKEIGTYPDMAAAQAKQTVYQDRDRKSAEEEKKKIATSVKEREKAAKEAQREAERKMIQDSVVALVEGKLKELKEQAGAPQPAVPQKGAAEKKP